MARIHVEVLDIAEDSDRVTLACAIDVLDTSVLAANQDGDDILHTIVLSPKSTSSAWQSRIAANVLASNGPLNGIVLSSALGMTNAANAISAAQVRVRGLPTAATSWPSIVLVASPFRLVNQSGGRTVGLSAYPSSRDLPDGTLMDLVVWCGERIGSPITVRLACRPKNALSSDPWQYLTGMELTLNPNPSNLASEYSKPARFVVTKSIGSQLFNRVELYALRNADAFWLYSTNPSASVQGSPKDQLTIYHASVNFRTWEG